MYDVSSGEILIDGIPIEKIKLKDLRKLFGTVTQESILFGDSIANNIRYGSLDEISEEEIEKSAKIANADEFIETFQTNIMNNYTPGLPIFPEDKNKDCVLPVQLWEILPFWFLMKQPVLSIRKQKRKFRKVSNKPQKIEPWSSLLIGFPRFSLQIKIVVFR